MKNNLQQRRKDKDLSLQNLGDMCGVSKTHIHGLEKERHSPTLKTAYVIAKILGVSVYDIWPDNTKVVEETITVRRVVSK